MSLQTMNPDDLNAEAMKVLELVTAEFESDPASVQCFDLRVVERCKAIVSERRRRDNDIRALFLR